ncbi:MAG: hypothetical protein IPN93_10325 [Bacteroidetes bacterium]|nr:hypothetical protein [Bacteroidota bacterium]
MKEGDKKEETNGTGNNTNSNNGNTNSSPNSNNPKVDPPSSLQSYSKFDFIPGEK